jgi:large subunit ribosomal protein L13
MKTVSVRQQDVAHDWYVVDAAGQTLGRLASEIARRLRGKHKAEYTPHVDTGDYIIVVNAEKVFVSGSKETKKIYYRHSGYPGGIKSTSLKRLREAKPEELLEKAVKGMLPRNPLGRAVFRKLKVYAGDTHPHGAQQPKTMVLS